MVRCGFRRGSGLGLWFVALLFAQGGGCDTFGDGYDQPPQGFFPGSGGKGSFGGSLGVGGSVFVDSGVGGTPIDALCPPGGTGGVVIVLDGGSEAGAAGEPNAGGQAGASSEGMSGGGGVNGVSGEAGMYGTGGAGDSGGSAGAPPLTGCPATEPEVGLCQNEGLECAYGDPINLTCRRIWTCFNGLWSPSRSCTPEQLEACPQTAPSHASVCTEQVVCAYPDGNTCECSFCGNDACWACSGPPNRPAGCPQQQPLAGAPCAVVPTECVYGECFTSQAPVIAVCCHGAWTTRAQSCPIPI